MAKVRLLTRVHKNEYRRVYVSISNCDKKLLEWVLKKVGKGKIQTGKIYSEKHTTTFSYRIICKEAIPFLKQIYPYLHTYKKERTELILKYAEKLTVRNGKYSKEMLEEKRNFVKKFLSINPTSRNRVLNFI